jgi:hypothetical protein
MKLYAGCISFLVLMFIFTANKAYGQDIFCDVTCVPSHNVEFLFGNHSNPLSYPECARFCHPYGRKVIYGCECKWRVHGCR